MYTKLNGTLVIDGVEQANGNLEIGVFDQDGICRGAKLPTVFPRTGQYVYQLQIRGNEGFTYSFRVYDHETETELNLIDNVTDEEGNVISYHGNYIYQYNGANTSLANPIPLNFSSGEASTLPLEIDAYTGEKDNYYLIAAPFGAVTAENVGGLMTPDYDFYSFDQDGEGEEGKEWINHRDDGSFELQPGVGYLYANNTGEDLVFSGSPLEGDNMEVELEFSEEEVAWRGWNLVGNPFEVSVYPNRPFYTMNETRDGYVSNDANTELPAMHGAFVEAAPEVASVTFYKEQQTKTSKLSLNLSNNHGVIDRAIVSFGQGQQLSKFMFRDNSTKVYIPIDGKDYSVVHSEGMGEMPVNFKAESNGCYTLSFTAEEVSFAYLHLIDNMTGADVDLLANPSYSFNARTSDYDSRFRLVFATGNGSDDTFAFFSNGNFVINNEGEATLQVIDVTGRILKNESINGCASVNVKAAPGVYMLRLVNGNDVKVQKVVVK